MGVKAYQEAYKIYHQLPLLAYERGLLAAGGTDGYMRVFSGFIKGLDSKESVAGSPWGDKFPFGSLVKEWYQGSYIHDVKWRSSQEQIAFVTHDAKLNIVDSQNGYEFTDSPDGLPFKALVWINDNEILCGGYSCHPVLFSKSSQGWKFSKNIDKIGAKTPTPQVGGEDEDENPTFGMSALKKFKELDLKGKVSVEVQESAHENTITELAPFAESNGQVTEVSSCGLDGKIVIYRI